MCNKDILILQTILKIIFWPYCRFCGESLIKWNRQNGADTSELTSFRRKYAGDIRTVGGLTKVLLISKANGPVWFNEGRVNENDYFE